MMLDRLSVTGERAKIPNLTIVVNKVDLVGNNEAQARFAPYIQMGYPVLFTSTVEGEGIATLKTIPQGFHFCFHGSLWRRQK
jgi:ribosome biogenesis GTPase